MAALEDFLDGEYVFHGSATAGIAVLVPRMPRDIGTSAANKEIAVYATADAASSIAFSLTEGLTGAWSLDHASLVARFPREFEDRLTRNRGALYVLRRSDFDVTEQHQYKSHHPVTPVAEVAVTTDDFVRLGGTIVFEVAT